ncbi:MAG: helix-turn-helix domain-containing protein [Bacteroidota bacterium]|nr:helix-turn-helix domain-containing protein [Bacteroidota bacterium]
MQNKIDYSAIAYNNLAGSTPDSPKLHMGEVLERIVRRDRMGISELARRLNVSRRTMYNWFETERISVEIIRRIGFVIGHDFSVEFPDEFAKKSDFVDGESFIDVPNAIEQPATVVYYWMDRYIKLLEKFNAALSHEVKFKGDGPAMLVAGVFLAVEHLPALALIA